MSRIELKLSVPFYYLSWTKLLYFYLICLLFNLRRHTGQRIVKCDFCEYLGYDSSDVIHHKERKHRDKYK